jgi:hypothetical protein
MPSRSFNQSNFGGQEFAEASAFAAVSTVVGGALGAVMGLPFGNPVLGATIGGGALGLIAFNGAVDEITNCYIAQNHSSQKDFFNARESFRSRTWRVFEPSSFALDPSVSQDLRDFQTACLFGSVILVGAVAIAVATIDGGATAVSISSVSPVGLDLLSGAWQTIDPSTLPELFNALDNARAGGESALQRVSQVLTGFSYYDEILRGSAQRVSQVLTGFSYYDEILRGSAGVAIGYGISNNPLFEKLVETLFINLKLADAIPGAKTYGQEYTSKVITSLKRYFEAKKGSFQVNSFEDFVAQKVAQQIGAKQYENLLQQDNINKLSQLKSGTRAILYDNRGGLHIEKLIEEFTRNNQNNPQAMATIPGEAVRLPGTVISGGLSSTLADYCGSRQKS